MPSVHVPTPVFKSAATSVPGQDFLEAEVDTEDFLPQDLVSADDYEEVLAIKRRETWSN